MCSARTASETIAAALQHLLELSVNLAASNLAEQPDDSNITLDVGWALETNRLAAHHLATLASELAPANASIAADLASAIAFSGNDIIQRLPADDLSEVYERRPDIENDCSQVCYSDGYSGHYLCEVSIDEVMFPCLGCPLIARRFTDFHQPQEWEHETQGVSQTHPVPDPPRNPGPPARRMMLDLTDAVAALAELKVDRLPAGSSARRRLAYTATALAQLAGYAVNTYFFALMDMTQLDREQAWAESQPQADRATAATGALYELATGVPYTEPDNNRQVRRTRCERAFQAHDGAERFYCNHLDTLPEYLQNEQSVAEMCRRCPFHQSPPHASLLDLAAG